MPELEESKQVRNETAAPILPITVIVAARNEARNLPRCLESLRNVGEVYVIDSQSTDGTIEIAQAHGAHVVQFHYQGGWPKKRQWAMESLPLAYDWIFLVDADEALTPELEREIREAIQDPNFDGYYVALRMFFLGRELRHSGASFFKLSLNVASSIRKFVGNPAAPNFRLCCCILSTRRFRSSSLSEAK